ncbi:putative disease resistance protein RGA3 isoform X1 [Miscanthus floridulus]|uniref:putative disease resistance protein RGA3 isoform X1 n=1 Tax=Miscanthus floridulus TaxID=154761 RepID=UPI003457C50E
MEVALVSAVLKIVGTKLAPLAIKEFRSKADVAKDIQELQDLVEEINDWLHTVGDKAIRNGRSSKWLKRLKEAAYDAEDVVHEVHIEAEKQDIKVTGGKNTMVKYLLTKPKSAVSEFKIAHKIKAIKSRFDAIVKGRSDYSTIANSMPVDHPVHHTRKTIGEVPFYTTVDETSVFGRDQEKNQITSELIETNSQQRIKIVSVIGLGGSGKTTLAKLVFNDGNIENHFEVRLWVHVSREFVVEKLVEKLFEAIAGDMPEHLPLQHVSRTISDKLAGKRFLAVLDDVWTEDRVDWERFMVHLKSGAPGSSILLTTRSRKVAEAVDSSYAYDLPFLSKEDSWKVFQQCFGIAMKALDTEFLQVGIEIVNKCGGVPLAIKVIAGILHGMKGIEEWQSISNSNLLDVQDDEHRVSACLWLSFVHLPDHLKPCFVYCSIFPRGYVINRRHLISQWIAHGFVPTNQARQPEDVGIGYFDSLLKVGFLQDQNPDQDWSTSDEVRCKMHDLIHDLARQILQDEFVSEIETNDQINRCRYLSLTSCTGKLDNKLCGKVRALYVSGRDLTFDKTMDKQCCVRTIILKYITADSLPLFISKFKYMGHLEISNVNCEALPEALSHCWNLQAIHVLKCTRLAVVPETIGKLKKLRTLELNHVWSIKSLPQSIGDCDNLRSLYLEYCGIKDIPNSLEKVKNLRILSIVECYNLQKLPPSESFGKLWNLQTLTLKFCWGLRNLPQCMTSLSHLESLDLGYCSDLVELPEGIGNLRNLKVLNLKRCKKLCGLPAGCGQLTRLQQLSLFVIGDSTKHARISELESLDKLNGELRIKNIKYVKDPGETDKVHLKEKNGIQKLSLDWYSRWEVQPNDVEEELSLNMEKDLHLLNSLEPPQKIEKLGICGYRGSQLPRWMTKQSDSCGLADDRHIVMQRNPPEFSHLTKLVLDNLPNLEHLGELVELPLIKILKLRGMPKLVELLTTTRGFATGEEGVECRFPHLSTLVISDCPKLVVKPYFPLSLQSLELEGSNGQLVSSGCFFHAHHRHAAHAHGDESSSSSCIVDVTGTPLKRLNLGRLIGSSSGWEVLQHLTGLHNLHIYKCTDLTHLPESIQCITSLRILEISDCANLRVLPDWLVELKSLQSLNLRSCNALQQLPEQIGELCSLQYLCISFLPSLTCLPESMQRLTSLQFLNLCMCGTLTQLPEWLGELSALQTLWLQSCGGLTSLPCSIQRLTALEELFISDNLELLRRCREGVGEDWHLVSHIKNLRLLD